MSRFIPLIVSVAALIYTVLSLVLGIRKGRRDMRALKERQDREAHERAVERINLDWYGPLKPPGDPLLWFDATDDGVTLFTDGERVTWRNKGRLGFRCDMRGYAKVVPGGVKFS